MRKNAKIGKLHLTSETLRQLDRFALEGVVGAVASNTTICLQSICLTSCNGCNTRNTCTTRFC